MSSLDYLGSHRALQSLDADPYWPKWDSPWWHMLLLHEMGRTRQIPKSVIERYVDALDKFPLKIFPVHPGEMPAGLDPYRDTLCHCYLGNVYQVLAAWGIDVDSELPWVRPWFLRYQMADGGLNCDNAAYLVKNEIPSSMVGTIAAFEAVLLHTQRPWNAEEEALHPERSRVPYGAQAHAWLPYETQCARTHKRRKMDETLAFRDSTSTTFCAG